MRVILMMFLRSIMIRLAKFMAIFLIVLQRTGLRMIYRIRYRASA
jgi:hypothetical protein